MGGGDIPECNIWLQGHAAQCEKNYSVPSPATEVFAAEMLWKRSMEYNFRYTTVVSDGDAKVYSHLKELNVYGANVQIEKEECIIRVSKRLGTCYVNEKYKKKKKLTKLHLGGQTFGSLTNKTITKLSTSSMQYVKK